MNTSYKVGGNKSPINASNMVESIYALSLYGLKAYEIASTQRLRLGSKTTSQMVRDAQSYDMTLSLHAEFGTTTLSNPDYDETKAVAFLGNAIEHSQRLGNVPIVVHPGRTYSKHGLDTMLMTLAGRLDVAFKEYNFPMELLYLETMGGAYDFGNVTELFALSNALGTRVCVDFAHLYARRSAIQESFDEAYVDSIINMILKTNWSNESYIHISGMKFDHRGEVKHEDFMDTDMPWLMVLDKLREASLGGRIIAESGYAIASDARIIKAHMESNL
jgi:deoxyribonuclease-4